MSKLYEQNNGCNETFTLSGQKVSKDNEVIHFIGTVDELNSHLGLIKAISPNDEVCSFIERTQRNLMMIMSCDPNNAQHITDEIAVLQKETDSLLAKVPEQHGFVLPGRNVNEAQIHITRAVARRAEREFVAANARQPLYPQAGEYLNKLSGYLFALSLAST